MSQVSTSYFKTLWQNLDSVDLIQVTLVFLILCTIPEDVGIQRMLTEFCLGQTFTWFALEEVAAKSIPSKSSSMITQTLAFPKMCQYSEMLCRGTKWSCGHIYLGTTALSFWEILRIIYLIYRSNMIETIYALINCMIYQISGKSCNKKTCFTLLKSIYLNIFVQNSLMDISIPDTHNGKYCPSVLPISDFPF